MPFLWAGIIVKRWYILVFSKCSVRLAPARASIHWMRSFADSEIWLVST